MQYQIRIKPGGKWHRRNMHIAGETACGEPLPGAFSSRDWQLDADLCETCFTKRERDTGEMVKLEKELLRDHDQFRFGGKHDDPPTDPNGDTITVVEKKPR